MCESASHQGDYYSLVWSKAVIRGTGAVLLEHPVANALFSPVRGQARRLGFVQHFDSIVDFIPDGEVRLFECLPGAVLEM